MNKIINQDKIEKSVKKQNSTTNRWSNFITNNWIPEGNQSEILKELKAKGVALYFDDPGEFWFRKSPNNDFQKVDKSKLATRLANALGKEKPLKFFYGKSEEPADIKANDLLAVTEKFSPFVNSEFYKEGGNFFRTSFKPTKYIKICPDPQRQNNFENIHTLINNLCNNDLDKYFYFINWLAGFLQTLKRSQQAFIFRGDQGTGKGLFNDYILKPLFGTNQVITVDDSRLRSQYKEWLPGKLFYTLNEISAGDKKTRKEVKNFLKQLITDSSMQAERKFQDAKEEELHGNVIIFSNEAVPLEIEPTDRRYTVFQTGRSLNSQNVNTGELITNIQKELLDFAYFLKNYEVDWKEYNQCLDTPEKRAISSATTNRYQEFVSMLKKRDPDLFLSREEDFQIYQLLQDGFATGFKFSDLLDIFNFYYGAEESNRTLPKKLRTIDPILFDVRLAKKIKGYPKFKIE